MLLKAKSQLLSEREWIFARFFTYPDILNALRTDEAAEEEEE